MFSRLRPFAFTKQVARSSASSGRQRFSQSARTNSLGITVLVGAAAVVVSSSLGSCYLYYTDEGLRRSIQCGWFCARLYSAYNGVKNEEQITKLNQEWAPKSFEFILDLGGYYIKLAQTSVGAGDLPEDYTHLFQTLLDRVPPRQFEVIRDVVEAELGCRIDDVFDSFDAEPLGSGCIGQVHRATLKGSGKEVAVKVQYPGVESTFKSDFRMLSAVLRVGTRISRGFADTMHNLYQTVEVEFDYTKEAAHLRHASETTMPIFGHQVFIPLPIDEDHPDAPNRSLCTRKVLTMEHVRGRPINKYLNDMMEAWARAEGKTVRECDDEMISIYDDPEKYESILANVSPERESGTPAACIAGIVQTLCDVHAHQVFMTGLFNSDPHAGNVIMMNDGRLGLIDYGACDTLTHAERDSFARLCVALADGGEQATLQTLNDFGDAGRKVATIERCMMLLMGIGLHVGFAPLIRMLKPTAKRYLGMT